MKLLGLSWWQAFLLAPGMAFMDWLARTYPLIVIRYDIGFSQQSYLFWSGIVAGMFWVALILSISFLWRRLRARCTKK